MFVSSKVNSKVLHFNYLENSNCFLVKFLENEKVKLNDEEIQLQLE